MTEPIGDRVRPIPMVRTLALVLVALVGAALFAGCGSVEKDQSAPSEDAGSSKSAESPDSSVPSSTPKVPSDEPPVTESFALEIPGVQQPVLATRQDHPRGGFQVRVFAAEGGAWTELEVDGRPLVPFAATDVQEHPFSADCGKGAVVLTEAVPHKSAGTPSWDIVETSYAVDGSAVTAGPSRKIAEDVTMGELPAKWPALVKHAMFESCRAAG